MPLYEYECDACGQRFELIQKFSDPAPEACAKCGKGPVQRQPSSPAIQFKGSGFYITDYARKGEGGKNEGGKSEGDKKGSGGESTAPSSDAGGEAKKSDAAPAAAPAAGPASNPAPAKT